MLIEVRVGELSFSELLDDIRKQLILYALVETNGNVTQAANFLRISRGGIDRWRHVLGIFKRRTFERKRMRKRDE